MSAVLRNLADARRDARDAAIDRLDSAVYSATSAAENARADCNHRLDSNDLSDFENALEQARAVVERMKGRT